MRKFAFLLAIVAVFAMSACAFADAGDIATIADPSGVTGMNNGAITADTETAADYKTPLYYYGETVPAAVKLGVKVTLGTASGNTNKISYQPTGGALVETSTATETTQINFDDIEIDLTAFATTQSPFKIGVANAASSPTDFMAATKTLAVNPVKVTFAADESAVNIKTSATDSDATKVTFSGMYGLVDIKDLTDLRVFVLDSAGKPDPTKEVNASGIAVVGDKTNGVKAMFDESTGGLELTGGTTNAGEAGKSVTLGLVKADGAELKIDQSKETTVAGTEANATLAASDVLATVTITTVDYIVEPASVTYDLDKSSDIAISFDIDMKSTELAAISCDGEVLLDAKANGTSISGTNDYLSNDIAVSADKPVVGHIVVTLGVDQLNEKIDSLVPEADGSISETVTYKVVDNATTPKSADLVIKFVKAADPIDPVYQEYEPTTAQQAAITEIIASADLGLAGTTSHTAINTAVDDTLTAALISDDVRGYFSISQTVANMGDYVAINGSVINAVPDTNESVTFYKNFGSTTDPDRVSLAAVTSGDVLQAAVLIVDNVCPANLQGAQRSAKDANKGLVIRTASNGTKVVVIYDGNRNGTVSDPIEARVNRWHSSSSSCSMGFGLAAVAGLAAIALRKRSK